MATGKINLQKSCKIVANCLPGGGKTALEGFFFATATTAKGLDGLCAYGFGVLCPADDAKTVPGFVGAGEGDGHSADACKAVAQLPILGRREVVFKMEGGFLPGVFPGNVGREPFVKSGS